MTRMRRPRLVSGIAIGVLITLLFLLPVLYAIMLAFESPSHFLSSPLTPGSPVTSNFSGAWNGADLGVPAPAAHAVRPGSAGGEAEQG